jgi:hypothetical protein
MKIAKLSEVEEVESLECIACMYQKTTLRVFGDAQRGLL